MRMFDLVKAFDNIDNEMDESTVYSLQHGANISL